MGTPRTLVATVVPSLTSPVPVVSGPVIAAVGFSILNNICTVVLGPGNLPNFGYDGPNGYNNVMANGSPMELYGGSPSANGDQVILWGFTVGTYLNALAVTVLDNNILAGSFRFYFQHANVAFTADAGNTAADKSLWNGGPSATQPGIAGGEHFRTVRVEIDAADGTDMIYIGDQNVSASRYFEVLSLTGQQAVEIASENIVGSRLWMVATQTVADPTAHVTLIY